MKEWQRELLVRDKKIVDETNSKKEALAFYGKYFHKMLIDIHTVKKINNPKSEFKRLYIEQLMEIASKDPIFTDIVLHEKYNQSDSFVYNNDKVFNSIEYYSKKYKVVLTSNELYNATENITKNIESTKSNFIFCVYAFVALILVYLWQTIIF